MFVVHPWSKINRSEVFFPKKKISRKKKLHLKTSRSWQCMFCWPNSPLCFLESTPLAPRSQAKTRDNPLASWADTADLVWQSRYVWSRNTSHAWRTAFRGWVLSARAKRDLILQSCFRCSGTTEQGHRTWGLRSSGVTSSWRRAAAITQRSNALITPSAIQDCSPIYIVSRVRLRGADAVILLSPSSSVVRILRGDRVLLAFRFRDALCSTCTDYFPIYKGWS